MIASWMLYALLVSALVAAAARLGEEVCRLRGAPVRWVWCGGLLAVIVLVALVPARVTSGVPAARAAVVLPAATEMGADAADGRSGPATLLAAARDLLARPLRAAAALGEGTAGQALGIGWAALSLALLAVGAATLRRSARARRAWPRREIEGVPVRVAPAVGPAVLGLRHPEVVVPGWLLAASAEEQRLVVLHEREHIRARDPLTLAAGCLAVTLLPWNPVAWWMLLRLRLAVELDCDARVLRRGVRARAYGTLLIEMAGRGPGLSLGVPALAGSPSTLERRLRAMNRKPPRFAPARAGLLGLLGAAAVVAACDTPMPTAADVEAMDVAAAEQQATRFRIADGEGMTYVVDGKEVTATEAQALVADRIARIEVQKNAQGGGVIRISTAATADAAAPTSGEPVRIRVRGPGAEAVTTTGVAVRGVGSADTVTVRTVSGANPQSAPLIVVDGVVVESSTLDGFDPNRIDKVEVLKGPAAAGLYSDPRAANGVIRITTKAAARQ